jgi:hypothetical protein
LVKSLIIGTHLKGSKLFVFKARPNQYENAVKARAKTERAKKIPVKLATTKFEVKGE